jgi:thioesterase domain-containing protein/acyl carrier protein
MRLAAYYVTTPGHAAPGPAELRAFLGQYLPDYMIPADYLAMDSLPVSAHGKIDRAALPAPDARTNLDNAAHIPPRTPIEERIAVIWREVLGLEQVGVYDNFFEQGGHSLLGIRLFTGIEHELGKRLPISLLFSAPTIAQLAENLEGSAPILQEQILVPIQAGGDRLPFFCVHGFGGGVLGYADLARLLGANQPFYGLQAYGLDGSTSIDTTIEAMASRYITAMRAVQPHGPYHIGGYCFGGVVAFEMARQLEAASEPVDLIAIIEGYAPRRHRRRARAFSLQRLQTAWHNIPYWLNDYWSMGLSGIRVLLRQKITKWGKRLGRHSGHSRQIAVQDVVADDLSQVPTHLRKIMEAHIRAIYAYAPEPIGCAVTLFAARRKTISQAFFGSLDAENGWGALTKGGVQIKMVDGGHRNIHMQPNVPSLAAALNESLQAVEEPAIR